MASTKYSDKGSAGSTVSTGEATQDELLGNNRSSTGEDGAKVDSGVGEIAGSGTGVAAGSGAGSGVNASIDARTDASAGAEESKPFEKANPSKNSDDSDPDHLPVDVDEINGRPVTGLMILGVGALFTITMAGLNYINSVFTPIFLALTLVLAFRPIGRTLIKRGLPSWFAILTTFIALIIVFTGTVAVTVWSLTPVPETLMRYTGNFEKMVGQITSLLDTYHIQTDDLSKYLKDLNFNSLISWVLGLLDSLSSISGLITIAIIALFFITLDTTTTAARSHVIRKSHKNLANALAGFEKRVRHYWIISTVFGLIVAVIDVFALEYMGIPLAWTWGMWAFITNYIPNVGFVLGVLPPMLMAALDQGWEAMLIVMVVYSVINVVIQTFLQPKFVGDLVGLSPTVTFFSLILWTSIVGVLGSILAVPLTLFFKAILVDSDPRTQWLDVFLVSEGDTKKRNAFGLYDVDQSVEDPLTELRNPLSERRIHPIASGKLKLSSLSRQLKREARTSQQSVESGGNERPDAGTK
ncbi:AI-2E family transporter [Arcanobacterium bovis]|uniref:AI-2E family transporter n=1 Tax=Arcanobacterium bovis TaxID=2529275 RepID=A0A4Q9UZC3_9ACTO|nr:AI-2E family transporter [Arcanobacterium bovis]TBW21021.1 AI-2E family transporter [Arcanobacterium bovis]